MKKYLLVFIIGILSIFAANSVFLEIKNKNVEEDMASRIIRFHVIANSDSPEDQRIKLMVRDRVLKDIGPKLENCKTKAESEYIINQNIETIKKIAEDELKDNGVDSKVAVSLGKSIFPAKIYSGVMVPVCRLQNVVADEPHALPIGVKGVVIISKIKGDGRVPV